MRAKNEVKFLAEAYAAVAGGWHENGINRRIILERVVDGVLMCPEACCGAPVMECKCPPDCAHCNCFMIQKAVKKYGLEDKLLQAEEDEEVLAEIAPILAAAGAAAGGIARGLLGAGLAAGRAAGTAARAGGAVGRGVAKAGESIADQPDDDLEDEEVHLRGTNFAAEPPPVDEEDIFPNSEYGDHLRRAAKQHEQEDKETDPLDDHSSLEAYRRARGIPMPEDNETDREATDREATDREEARDQMWAKRKARWNAWKKKQARSEDNEYIDHDDPKWDVEMSDVDKEEFGSEPKRGVRAPKLPDLKSGIRRLDDVIKSKQPEDQEEVRTGNTFNDHFRRLRP